VPTIPGDTLLVATTNPGKVREIRLALAGAPVALRTLADVPAVVEPEETGRTFADNARLKAEYYRACTGWPTVAEDSGLAIDAIGARPGVESARYPGATYAEKFANLYRELAPHPRPWSARFVCELAVCAGPAPAGADEAIVFRARGVVEGEIAPEPRGTNGFGYDPIFFFPPYGCTLGEVSDERKLAVSHRGQAFRKLAAWLTGQGV
jgi:non-canonical purine NTP pyrophosphatase (RdgB/HAM1 family)